MKIRDVKPKWHGMRIGLAFIAFFVIGFATGFTIKAARGADLRIPKLIKPVEKKTEYEKIFETLKASPVPEAVPPENPKRR